MGVAEDVQQGAARVVEPLRLLAEPAAILLVVAEDVQHRLPLVGEPLVGVVEVTHDVQERTPALLRLGDAKLELGDAFPERGNHLALGERLDGLGVHPEDGRKVASSCRRLSSSFSSAIILSSRPTTTSSNFSRSRIFSWSSVFDCSRSRTTCS